MCVFFVLFGAILCIAQNRPVSMPADIGCRKPSHVPNVCLGALLHWCMDRKVPPNPRSHMHVPPCPCTHDCHNLFFLSFPLRDMRAETQPAKPPSDPTRSFPCPALFPTPQIIVTNPPAHSHVPTCRSALSHYIHVFSPKIRVVIVYIIEK